MAMLGVCLALAASAAAPVFLHATDFTLAWTHSIEKVRWEEDYGVRQAAATGSPPVLHALQARVRGSAAGMEPPPDARLINGWYVYTPGIAPAAALALTRSEFTPDYEFCTASGCQPMSALLASDGGVTTLSACAAPAPP
jgi:hypothetical protein